MSGLKINFLTARPELVEGRIAAQFPEEENLKVAVL
jgi:hypothetical protein